ncbi:DUF421 domain-containing protein [Jeotgalibacillus proteolyticus]|uniref:YetF C-terminal domain-containing protein n=1 Tax=Jeotgalibacillus proteolyticus TaxID=2082395 RepID=A0A2S5G7B4_9BACL|nr:DUF421 domain-containing protein [Jeotgalibacillus proteolyticus]PPA68872.1 hypothetical protein C4B60_18310 [Jeotgalibacillus proteolyticus]
MPEWLIVIIRSIFMLIALFFATKMLGKKQISQLSFFEYVVGITAGSIGAEVITGLDESFIHGVLGIGAFISLPVLADRLSLKSKKLRDFFEGKGTVFIQNGNVLEESLKKEKYTIDELMELLRKKDVFNLSDVEFAILEPTGDLNVLLKREKQPLTPSDMHIAINPLKEPCLVIMDGNIMNGALDSIRKSEEWLRGELEKKSVRVEDVFICQIDSHGDLSLDLYDHIRMEKQQDPIGFIKAALERSKADLDLFALSASNEEGMLLYKKNSDKLKQVLHSLQQV